MRCGEPGARATQLVVLSGPATWHVVLAFCGRQTNRHTSGRWSFREAEMGKSRGPEIGRQSRGLEKMGQTGGTLAGWDQTAGMLGSGLQQTVR